VLALAGCDFEDKAHDQNHGQESGSTSPPNEPGVDGGSSFQPVVPPPAKPDGPANTRRFGEPRPSDLPRPINGGTLIVTKDGKTAVAADPDRDRVSIVDIDGQQVLVTVKLDDGVEPGRLVEDSAGKVHVVLRATGEVATIDVDSGELVDQRGVCPVPQGIAYRAADDSLLVACTSGELVTLPAHGSKAPRSVRVEKDLRDVIVSGERTFVTRFKSAELIELDASGKIIARTRPPEAKGPFLPPSLSGREPDAEAHPFTPSVAWRALARPDGGVVMLHQRGRTDVIDLKVHPNSTTDDFDAGTCFSGCGGGSYGSGALFSCDSIVHSTLSQIGDESVAAGPIFSSMTLAVDAAISGDGQYIALGIAGNFNDGTSAFGTSGALVMPLKNAFAAEARNKCLIPGDLASRPFSAGQVIAVAFTGDHTLLVQSREPNRLFVVDPLDSCSDCALGKGQIDLGGQPRRDPGHDLFHTNAGAGLACASCHPVGGDDGRTWQFSDVGARRTQLFNMGIMDTLPLHWGGELANLDALIAEVFVRRMGGVMPDVDREVATGTWIESMHPNNPMRARDDAAALRGKALFESPKVGCANCHNGKMLTNNTTVDVGTGGSFQVPSLIGVAYHQPFMHDGCARTLHQRFDPACGGKQHGDTSQLEGHEIDDLVAYLESL
jgi:hypothetical protein